MSQPNVNAHSKKEYQNRKHIYLDLDQTLISSETRKSLRKLNPVRKNKLQFHFGEPHNMEDYYYVYERPGLQDLLKWLFEKQ